MTRSTLAFLLVAGACGPDTGEEKREEPGRYAEAVCDAADRCGCSQAFSSLDACEQEYRERLDDVIREFDFDEDCFTSVLDGDAFQQCMSSEEVGVHACTLLQGDKNEAEPCSERFLNVPPFVIDECSDDLVCMRGQCRPPEFVPPAVGEGSPCFYDAGASCPSTAAIDLYCGADERCHAQVSLGESCDAYDACEQIDLPGLYCSGFHGGGTGTCEVRSLEGEPCDPENWTSCYSNDGIGWCDPEVTVCASSGPSVCFYAEHPFRFRLPKQP